MLLLRSGVTFSSLLSPNANSKSMILLGHRTGSAWVPCGGVL